MYHRELADPQLATYACTVDSSDCMRALRAFGANTVLASLSSVGRSGGMRVHPDGSVVDVIPLYRHPDMHFADKLLNQACRRFSPLASIPKDATAVFRARNSIDVRGERTFDSYMSIKKGWKQTVLMVPRGDGTDLEIVLLTRLERRAGLLDPAVMFLHGGAYTTGTHRDPAIGIWNKKLTAGGARRAAYICVKYRLAPEHCQPAGADDCERAFDFIYSSAELADQLGFDQKRSKHAAAGTHT